MSSHTIKNLYFSFFLLLWLASCKQRPELAAIKLKAPVNEGFNVKDSIKTYNDSLSFEYFITDRWKSNQLLAFQLPVLNLTEMDTVGTIKREISRAGLKEQQFRSQFLNARWFGNKLYVLAEGNYFTISIFDKQLKFLKKVHLNELIDNSYAPLKTCSFELLKGSNGNIKVLISNGDNRYQYNSSKYYKNAYGLLSFELTPRNQLVDVHKLLPLNDFSSIKQALEKNERTWNSPNILFSVQGTLLYVKPVFDKNIYVYNVDTYKLLRVYELSIPEATTNFKLPFDLDQSYDNDASSQIKMQYSNIKYVDFKTDKEYLYLMAIPPISSRMLPKSPNEIGALKINSCIYRIDLSNNSLKKYTFNSKYNPYSFYLNDKEVMLSSNSYFTDSPKIYKIKLY
jgi:hypothetical protein